MNTITRYTKAILKKILAAMSFVALSIIKTVFKVIFFFYKFLGIPVAIICCVNGVTVFFGAPVYDCVISFIMGALALALYFTMPAVASAMDMGTARMARVIRRPLVYKSRLKYTLG